MTRKRIRHEQLPNASKRNSIFEKRVEGMLKKAEQLSILCGMDIGVVAHKRGRESNAVLWPSPEVFGEQLGKFLNFQAVDRARKMVIHEKYMQQMVCTETRNLFKARQAVEAKEVRRRLLAGLDSGEVALEGMDLAQLTAVRAQAEDMRKALYKRAKELGTGAGRARAEGGRETLGAAVVGMASGGGMWGGYGEVGGSCSLSTAVAGGGSGRGGGQYFTAEFGVAPPSNDGFDGSGSRIEQYLNGFP